MSVEQPASCRLVIRAPAGVGIRVRDHAGRPVIAGADVVDAAVPEGLYAIEWISAGATAEQIVRVSLADSPVEVAFDAAGAGLTAADGPWPPSELVSQIGRELRPVSSISRSSVAVIVTGDSSIEAERDAACVAVINNRQKEVRPSDGEVPQLPLAAGESAHCYRLVPGRYRIRFQAVAGEMLEQSIPVLPGRQTIIFLSVTTANLLIPDGAGFARERGRGVDPGRTLIVTVEGNEDERRVRERVRLAGVLLHDLATGSSSLSSEFESILDDNLTDPLLKLYAALVVLMRLDQHAPPAIDQSSPDDPESSHLERQWAARAASWIPDPSTRGLPTDAAAALWHIDDHYPNVIKQFHERVPGRIESPPMLDCSWRWAIERSIRNSRAVAGTATLLAAGRSSSKATPWLCWSPAAAKAAPSAGARTGDLESLTREVAEKVERLLGGGTGGQANPQLLGTLNPESAETARRAAQAARRAGEGTSASAAGPLAVSLQLPAAQLSRHLANTSVELESALSAQQADLQGFDAPLGFGPPAEPAVSPRLSAGRRPAPEALRRRIEDPEDPNRGRFGGRAAADGFRASAKFERLSRDWTRINISVKGRAIDGTPVHFYLHDSFTPMERSATFRRGQAQTEVTAWGGFTVGIWIPSENVELELDLATVRGAPSNIRNR